MEAPTIKDIQQKTIDLKIDNQKYRLTLSYGINLKITIECLDKKQSYENEFTSNEITKINRYFLMCETIKDISDELSSHLNDQTKIEFKDKMLALKVILPSQKNNEADFMLKLKKKSLEEEVNYLNERINEQEKIINEQKIIISNQGNDIKTLKDKISNLENKISNFENIFNSSKDAIKVNNNNDEKIRKLKQLIGRNCNLILLYQMTKDGSQCSTFHDKVDNQGPTITLFESEDGYKFGGYTSKSFNQESTWIKDCDSFVFNFINLNKYPIKNKDYYAIYHGLKSDYGPEFYDILNNSSDIKKGSIRVANYINKQDDLKGGDDKFINKEVLVYKVDFL